MPSLGQRIRAIWDASGLLQKQIVAAVGVERQTMTSWMKEEGELGWRQPTLDSLKKFADATGAKIILDLDHPEDERRLLTLAPHVAGLAADLDALTKDDAELLGRIVRAWPHASRKTALALAEDAEERAEAAKDAERRNG